MVTVAVVGSVSVGVWVSANSPFMCPLLKLQTVLIRLLSFFDLMFLMAFVFEIKAIFTLKDAELYYAERQMNHAETVR